MRRWWSVLAVLAAIPAVCHAQASAAPASREAALAQYQRTNVELKAWADEAEAGGRPMPTLRDPKAAPLIRAAFDVELFPALQGLDVGQIPGLCQQGLQSEMIYLMHGVQKLNAGKSDTALSSAAQRLIEENTATYQDEFSLGTNFTLRCSAFMASELTRAVAKSPAPFTAQQRAGLAQIRSGIVNMYEGLVQVQASPDLHEANRALLLDAAVRDAADLASVLDLESRRKVVAVLDMAVLTAPPATRGKLLKVRAAMTAPACTGLCAA